MHPCACLLAPEAVLARLAELTTCTPAVCLDVPLAAPLAAPAPALLVPLLLVPLALALAAPPAKAHGPAL